MVCIFFLLSIILSFTLPQGSPKQPLQDPLRLTTFAVETIIQFRYARTSVHLEAINPSKVAQEFPFSFTLPETAFVMNMSLTYDDMEHVARVVDLEVAELQYRRAVKKGETAAQVRKTERDTQRVSVDVNIEPGKTVAMVVTYEELLDRKVGRYKYRANISPGSVVDNYTVNVQIDESLPIKDLQSFNIFENTANEDDSASEDIILGDVELVGENTATITYNPSRQEQERVGRDGITGQINVEYDVERNNKDNIVQVKDGYFVHYFTPDVDTLPKHMIFVLDTSGSMEGVKMKQLKDAMVTIVEDLNVQDYISIISFSDDIRIWDSSSRQVSQVQNEAFSFILQLEAVGGTNINKALLAAVNVAGTLKQSEENVTQIIFFLTDGDATEGETSPETILENVKNRNRQGEVYVPIFSLAFGADADIWFLDKISLDNFGFSKKIYEGVDAVIQLEGFYQTIAKPLLKNIKFEYVGDIWEKNSLSESGNIPTIFKGGANIAVGKLNPDHKTSASENRIIIGGEGVNGRNRYNHSVGFTDITNISSSSNTNFVERLWAFKTIKRLLTADPQRATFLSLKYNFVTELTSLIVTKSGEEIVLDDGNPLSKSAPQVEDEAILNIVDLRDNETPLIVATTTTTTTTTRTTTPPFRCNITIFTKSYIRGDHQTFTEDQENLGSWDNKLVSLKVNGDCCWKIFTEVNYGGNSKEFCERAYNTATDLGFLLKDASSLKLKYVSSLMPQALAFYGEYDSDDLFSDDPFPDIYSFDDGYYIEVISNNSSLPSPITTTTTIATATPPPPSRCNITIFTKSYIRGDHQTFTENQENLGSWDNKLVSLKVNGDCCWKIFTEVNYGGNSNDFCERAYNTATDLGFLFRDASSLCRLVGLSVGKK